MQVNKKTIFSILVLFFVVGVLVYTVKPTYQWLKGMRADQIAESALDAYLLEPNNVDVCRLSIDRVRSAYQLAPNRYDVNRAMGTILTFVKPSEAFVFWERASVLNQRMPVDHSLAYVQCMILLDKFDDAEKLLKSNLVKYPNDFRIIYNLVKVSLVQRNATEAYRYSRQLILNVDSPISYHLEFIKSGFESEYEPWVQAAKQHFEVLVRDNELISDELMWGLLDIVHLPQDIEQQLVKIMNKRVHSFWEDVKLVEYRVSHQLISVQDGYDDLYSKVDLQNQDECYIFARWCSQNEFHERVAELISDEMSLMQKDWFLLLLKSLTKLEQWTRVRGLVHHQYVPVDSFWHYMLKTQLEYQTDHPLAAVNMWHRARLTLPTDMNGVMTLFQAGCKLGLEEESLTLIDQIVHLSQSPEDAFNLLGAFLLERGQYDLLYRCLSTFHYEYPAYDEITNEWAYYAFIFGKDIEDARGKMETLSEEHSNALRFQFTWAAGKIIDGQYAEVLDRLKHFKVEWKDVFPRWRFLLSMALVGVGEFEQADNYLKSIDIDCLIPDERRLYDQLMEES